MDALRWASLPEDLRVMPFNLRFMGFVGLWGPRRKVYKFVVPLIYSTMVIMFPKVVLGIGSSDITVICKGVAEFVFELPNFVTLTILALKRQRFEMVIQGLDDFFREVAIGEESKACYDLIRKQNNTIKKVFNFLVQYCAYVFGYSYLGSELAEEAEAVGKAIYDLPWYEHSVELQRFYRLIIQRTQRPTGITGKFDLNLLNVMIIFLLTLVQAFGYSYLGTELAEEAEAVGKAIYDLPWYEHSVELQRYYRLIIQRTQRPTGITGAKFFIVQRTTFAS
ncbi:hypothetical protein pipiens_005652, partial [Culex pipiens pipiens]